MLVDDIELALNDGLRYGARIDRNGPTHEVDALVGLFKEGLPRLDAALRANFPGTATGAAGVFCHQSPYVTLHGGRCELGDLLIAVRDSRGSAPVDSALLLQLKLGKVAYSPGPQRDLYEQWPPFHYDNGAQRQVSAPVPHDGGQYGFVTVCDKGCGRCRVETAVPQNVTVDALSAQIDAMLAGISGRQFTDEATAALGVDWDRVVWDLLQRAMARIIRYRRHKWGGRSFNHGLFVVNRADGALPTLIAESSLAGELAEAYGDPDLRPPDDPTALERPSLDDDDRGVSVILIDVGGDLREG